MWISGGKPLTVIAALFLPLPLPQLPNIFSHTQGVLDLIRLVTFKVTRALQKVIYDCFSQLTTFAVIIPMIT